MDVDDSEYEPFKTRLVERSTKQPRDRHPAGMDVNGVGEAVGYVVDGFVVAVSADNVVVVDNLVVVLNDVVVDEVFTGVIEAGDELS
jgi:hypothetical protein